MMVRYRQNSWPLVYVIGVIVSDILDVVYKPVHRDLNAKILTFGCE
jgi:hypothetical protein